MARIKIYGFKKYEEQLENLSRSISEIEGKVSECLSGAFVCLGGSGLQCGVQQPSREQKKGTERVQRFSEKMKAERGNQKIIR